MADVNLGIRTLARASTPKERQAGAEWIERAAQANLAMALARLGNLYLSGTGVPQDTSQGLLWLNRAARRGAPAPQLQLAEIYAVGAIVPVDKAKAYYWHRVAAKPVQSDVTIFNIMQVRFFAGMRARTLAASLTPAERESVRHEVADWVPTASVPYSGEVNLGSRMR
ncbi:MAG: tetratricopeptide repeat protein [Steroidobacteraceae bacterium]